MIHFFMFNGKSSRNFGLYISGSGTFNAPERVSESIEIPGRNGKLTISQNRFQNITVSYPAFIRTDFSRNAQGARAWLLQNEGYYRLEDTYHPDYYRMARFSGPIDFDMRFLNYSGETTLSFDCKPQRWSKNGENPVLYTQPAILMNDLFPALPLIKVNGTGAGNLYVGKYTVQMNEIDEYVMLDSETQNAYKDTLNKNGTISADKFPVLEPGENTISWDGGITSIEVTPRWWTI